MLLHRLSIVALISAHALVAQVEPRAGTWLTWVVPSVDALRPQAPPTGADSASEIQALKALLATGDADSAAKVAYWDAGSPGYRWVQLASQKGLAQNLAPTLFTRAMALVNIAVYDATVVAWDSKYAYNRKHPSAADSSIVPSVGVPNSPSYPSEHAVAAGAASAVLAYLFPDQRDVYAGMADEAARSRMFAGVAYPSDVSAGLQLGRAVGELVVAYARQDGSDTPFTGAFPAAAGIWSSANPVTPLAGTWRPWVLTSGGDFRLPAPPSADSADFQAQVAADKNFARTNVSNHSAWFWQPSFYTPWLDTVSREVLENHLDQNAPRAARVYALEAIAVHDATLACWDTKFAYLELRPSLADASIVPLFANPQHPGFPSGHACASQAAATVLSYLFPNDAAAFTAMAMDGGASTFYAAIHTMFDVQQGSALGGKVAQQVVGLAQIDGAQ